MDFDGLFFFVLKVTILFGMAIMFLWNVYGFWIYLKWYRKKWRELTE